MANNISFSPMGKTNRVNATSGAANNVTITSDSPCQQYLLYNGDATNDLFVWLSPSTSPVNVAIATGSDGNAAYGVIVDKDSWRIITGPQSSSTTSINVSVRSLAGTPFLYITPGEGR